MSAATVRRRSLGLVIGFHVVTQRDELIVGERVNPDVATDPRGLESFGGSGLADAEDVGECDLQTLLAREINTKEACHSGTNLSVSGRSRAREGVGVMRPLSAGLWAPAFVRRWHRDQIPEVQSRGRWTSWSSDSVVGPCGPWSLGTGWICVP